MNVLFVHNNFPAQFVHIARRLAQDAGHRVAAIGAPGARALDGVDLRRYREPDVTTPATHAFARRFDAEGRRAEQVMFVAAELKSDGFEPDIVFAHCGWGETLPLRAMFRKARFAVYCEYYYRGEGQDVHFDPVHGRFGVDGLSGVHALNASTLLALAECDIGVSPTQWQRSTFPPEFQGKIAVVHEGVDVEAAAPRPLAHFTLPGGRRLTREDEVVTYIARSLEPVRGFPVFMRALPQILERRPRAEVVVVGGEAPSYGPLAEGGLSWKRLALREALPRLDLARVHFLDRIPRDAFHALMQVSSAHVYLSHPFVLSWSLVEAMSTGCAIVASDTAPVREAIEDGRNGRLVDFHDPDALARAVAETLADPARARALGAAARADARARYDHRVCAETCLALLGLDSIPPVPRRGRAAELQEA